MRSFLMKNMENYNTLQKEIEAFEKEFQCIAIQCDNKGTIPNRIGEDEWEAEQCEYCYTVRFPLIEKYKQSLLRFTRSVIEEAMPEEKKIIQPECVEDVESNREAYNFNTCRAQFQENVERILKDNK